MTPGSATPSATKRTTSPNTPAWVVTGDGLLALIGLTLVVMEIWVIGDFRFRALHGVTVTVLAPVVMMPVAFRSIAPLPAFLINSVGTVAMVTFNYDSDFYQWANLLLLFSVAVAFAGWTSWLALGIGLGGVGYYFATFPEEGLSTGIMITSLWLVAWLAGRIYGSQAEQARLRTDRDLAAELAATRQERLELEAQRTNMAREVHDLVGHTINVMVVHAGAGRRAVRDDPDGAERAFETIETTGRSALDELDRVLGLLRGDDQDTPLAPMPDLGALADLVSEFDTAGLAVELSVVGPVDSVPRGLGLSVYRIVQEALTNTMKHSKATSADVSVVIVDADTGAGAGAGSGGVVNVTVADPGPARKVSADGQSPGRGLVGIAERAQLHGGHAHFGLDASEGGEGGSAKAAGGGGGFTVQCTLPLARTEVNS